ncbi:MAG: hypothetical protein R3C20_09800 [Planctomycetaceae bacterium]
MRADRWCPVVQAEAVSDGRQQRAVTSLVLAVGTEAVAGNSGSSRSVENVFAIALVVNNNEEDVYLSGDRSLVDLLCLSANMLRVTRCFLCERVHGAE